MQVVIAPQAKRDIANILAWTLDNFGPQMVKHYRKLMQTAIEAVAADPKLAGSSGRPDITENCRTYHLFHSRKRASGRGTGVRNPRHFLLYRVAATGVVEIGRVLHDSMDLEQHLPDKYRKPVE